MSTLLSRLFTVLAVFAGVVGQVHAGNPNGNVPELGSATVLTAVALVAGASLILANRRKDR